MLDIVQCYRYSGGQCSVRVGRGVATHIPLEPAQCIYFDFVESMVEVHNALRVVRALPKRFRGRDRAIDTLDAYARSPACRQYNRDQDWCPVTRRMQTRIRRVAQRSS